MEEYYVVVEMAPDQLPLTRSDQESVDSGKKILHVLWLISQRFRAAIDLN